MKMRIEEYKPKTKVQKYFKKLGSMKYQDMPLAEDIIELKCNVLSIKIEQFGLKIQIVYHGDEHIFKSGEYIEVNISLTSDISQYKSGFRFFQGEYAYDIDQTWTELNVYDFQEKVIKKYIELARYIKEFFINLKEGEE